MCGPYGRGFAVPSSYYIRRTGGHTAGALATRSDEILGCGEQKILSTLQMYPETRLATFVHLDVELTQNSEFRRHGNPEGA